VIKKCLCTWWLQYRKLQVMFKVSSARLQTFVDTPNCVLEDRVQYSTVHIPNVLFCNDRLFFLRVFCTIIIRCTETFWSPVLCVLTLQKFLLWKGIPYICIVTSFVWFCIDIPEDGLSTGRNMLHTCQSSVVLDWINVVGLISLVNSNSMLRYEMCTCWQHLACPNGVIN
jgi:hypothetical protein